MPTNLHIVSILFFKSVSSTNWSTSFAFCCQDKYSVKFIISSALLTKDLKQLATQKAALLSGNKNLKRKNLCFGNVIKNFFQIVPLLNKIGVQNIK